MPYENITTANVIKIENRIVTIKRCTKIGTKRVFFYPTYNGLRITKIMFSRLSEAEKVATLFLKRKPFRETQI